jgi:hypothetical protein
MKLITFVFATLWYVAHAQEEQGSSTFLRGAGAGGGSGENNANVELDVNFIEPKCLTEADCEEQMSEGYDKFEVGNFPLSGCFTKDGILYWGTGENFDQSMDLDAFFQSGGDVEGVFCYVRHEDEMDAMHVESDIAAIENTVKELDNEMVVMHEEADIAAIENTEKELDNEMDVMHEDADIAAIENTIKELDNEMVVMHEEDDIAAVESDLSLAEEMENGLEIVVQPKLECLTETDCEEQMSQGYEMFEVGDFPLSGCFAKDRILYWGTGKTFDESMDLDAFFQSGGAVEGVFC